MQFQVIFESLVVNTPEEREKIKNRLIEKFKVPADKAERMINSAPIVVKKDLTQEQANKYKSALESIGARASIRLVVPQEERAVAPDPNATQATAPPIPKPSPPPASDDGTTPNLGASTKRIDQPSKASAEQSGPDFPVFYHNIDSMEQAQEDPFKTVVSPPKSAEEKPQPAPKPDLIIPASISVEELRQKATPNAPVSPFSSVDERETPTKQQFATTAESTQEGGDGWFEKLRILNPPFDESVSSITPITSGRVSAQQGGFSISHPMIDRILFAEIRIATAFQIGHTDSARQYIDLYGLSSLPTRPVRLDGQLINLSSFSLAAANSPTEKLAGFIKFLLQNNPNIVIDLATYRFLKDRSRIKIVSTERDLEKYSGKLQSELDKGLSPEANPNVLSWREARDLLDQNDPWAPQPPPPLYPPMGPQPGMPPFPPSAYTTQPIKPPGTTPAMGQNYPPQQQPPQRQQSQPFQQPPQQYQPPYQQPYQQPYQPPPQNYPQPGYAPKAPPFAAPGQMPGQTPQMYQGPAPMAGPIPGQYPMPGQMPGYGGYSNPTMDFEINKAKEGAKTSLYLSIGGLVCCFPLAIVGLIKAQDALKIMDNYGIEDGRSMAVAAKVIAIIGLILHAISLMAKFLR